MTQASRLARAVDATAGVYPFLVMLVLAAALAITVAKYRLLISARLQEREEAALIIHDLRTTVHTGSRLPSLALSNARNAHTISSDSLAAHNQLIYYFSPDCLVCRQIDPQVAELSKVLPIVWVSTLDSGRTRAYIDSIGVVGEVWHARNAGLEKIGIASVPALLRVAKTENGIFVESAAIGAGGVSFLLSLNENLDARGHAAVRQIASLTR